MVLYSTLRGPKKPPPCPIPAKRPPTCGLYCWCCIVVSRDPHARVVLRVEVSGPEPRSSFMTRSNFTPCMHDPACFSFIDFCYQRSTKAMWQIRVTDSTTKPSRQPFLFFSPRPLRDQRSCGTDSLKNCSFRIEHFSETYAIRVVASLFLTMGDGQCARDTRPLPKTSRNNAALGMIGGAFARILALTAPFVVRQLRSSLSYSATPRRKVERALKYVLSRRTSEAAVGRHGHDGRRPPHDQALRADPRRPPPSRYRYVDLGAGDGAATLSAAVLGFAAMGVELNPTLWCVASARRLLSRTRSRFVLGDMFASSGVVREQLRRADCVMVFGVTPLMPKIAALVQSECLPGCFLMSYRFRVPLLTGGNSALRKDDGSPNKALRATLVYDQEDMRIYELHGKLSISTQGANDNIHLHR